MNEARIDPYDQMIKRIAESKGSVHATVARLLAPIQSNVLPVDNKPDNRVVTRRKIKK